jgi:hypothetical protein
MESKEGAVSGAATARRILDNALTALVDSGRLRREAPRRYVGTLGDLTILIEAELWPDRAGRFMIVHWGVDYPPARDPAFNSAEDAFVNGNLKGLAGQGRGVMPIRLPGAPHKISDYLPGTLRPASEDDASQQIRELLTNGLDTQFARVRSASDLASYIEDHGDFLTRNGIWPEDAASQAHSAATLFAAGR